MYFGHALKTQGIRAEAEHHYREAVRYRPSFGDAYWSLANLKTYRFSDQEIADMREQVEAPTNSAGRPLPPVLCAGQGLRGPRQLRGVLPLLRAWQCLQEGRVHLSPESLERTAQKQTELCTREFFEQRQGFGCNDPAPDLHRRPATRRLDAAGADPGLALAGRRHDGTRRHSAAGQLARPASERRSLPGRRWRCPRPTTTAASARPTSATRVTTGSATSRSSSTRCRTISATSA